MGFKLKLLGLLIALFAVCAFVVNFGFYDFFGLAQFIPAWLWNPLSVYITPLIVGDIPLVGGSLGWILNGIWNVIYSAVLLVIGVVLMK